MGTKGLVLALALSAVPLAAQTPCANTPAYTTCEFSFDLADTDAAAHPNPYLTVDLHAEFKSPTFRTYLMPAFWDGGRRMVIRFAPTEAGNWEYRVTSNIKAWDARQGTFTAASSELPGFIAPRNVHHWAYAESNRPHLWMGDTCYRFAFLDEALFQHIVDARAAQKFTHIRGLVLGTPEETSRMFPQPDRPDPAAFQKLDQRVVYMNRKGIIADLILAGPANQLAKLFPTWQQRRRYIRYLVARYAPMNITWQGFREFEDYENGRPLLKEVGALLKEMDPYRHPRSTGTAATSGPLLDDEWQNFVTHQAAGTQVAAIEHQLFAVPFVNLGFGAEDSGAGKGSAGVDLDTFRHRLWNATMDGQYLTYANTGTDGSGALPVDARFADAPGAKMMTAWFDFFSGTRHWELEPFFDVDGGRGLALEGIEYIVYVEKPGPVEVQVEKHGYDVAWINPLTGERLPEKKGYKGEHFTGEPPDRAHDWVLQISREGHKEGMLKSYKFESQRIEMQVIEQNAAKVPFQIVQPAQDFSLTRPPQQYAIKLTRETHATRSMLYLWTAEVAADGQGYRVAGTGPQGTLQIPPALAAKFPAVLSLRLYGMNAVGKVYAIDRAYQVTP